jgi:LacI family sucrose operon transcriptional repressor
MITIKDIAAMANVSRSTVSRALNNSGYVSEDARKRIEKVVKETGYIPSQQAQSLRTKETKIIGVILPTIQTETSSKIFTGVDSILSEHGYQILLATTQLDTSRENEYLNLLQVRQVDGIILVATNTDSSLLEEVNKLRIPIVVIGQEIDGVANVLYNDYHVARELTSLFIRKGHTKVGFIGVDETDKAVGYLRQKGYLDQMKENDLEIEKHWIQKGVFNVESGYHAMETMMKQSKSKPTAIFAVTDRLAIGAMSYLKDIGLHIPDDVAIAGIGASEISQYVEPTLTTVDYRYKQAGIEAATLLLQILSSGRNTFEKIVLDYRLVLRNSI